MSSFPETNAGAPTGETIAYHLESKGLRFPPELETAFLDDYFQKSLGIVRISLVLGILMYSAFGFLDPVIAPRSKYWIWGIRYLVVVPVMAASLLLTWRSVFKRIWQYDLSVMAFFAGVGITTMIAISTDRDVTRYYYAGLILVLMWSYTINRLRFWYATVSSWIIIISYQVTALYFQGMWHPELRPVYINNNFFFISANILGMLANYLMERYARNDFLQRHLIMENQKLLETERNALVEKSRLIKTELEMARRIQQRMMPQENPDSRIYSLYKPMEEVGGDYFDFLPLGDPERLGVFLSDVSGHGVPAAFITSMIKSTIAQARELAQDPARLLTHLNATLLEQTNENFITAFYGIFDFSQRTFLYANAGHPPPFVCLGTRVLKLESKVRHMPIAVVNNAEMLEKSTPYRNYRTALPAGAKLVLYTDGLVEARRNNGDTMFFEEILEDKMMQLKSLKAKEFVEGLFRELVSFRGADSFDDDICLICLDVV